TVLGRPHYHVGPSSRTWRGRAAGCRTHPLPRHIPTYRECARLPTGTYRPRTRGAIAGSPDRVERAIPPHYRRPGAVMKLRIAFQKGRGAADALDLMPPAGVLIPDEFRAGRITMIRLAEHDVDCFILRGDDIPPLLTSGHLDAAIASSIVFDEHASDSD